VNGTAPTNLQSGTFWQAVKNSGRYAEKTDALPPVGPLPQVKQLYEGFVEEGGTLMGLPLIGIGFNSTMAWTHTESTDGTTSTAYTVDDVDLADEWRMANQYFEMGRGGR
jgi:hypothetical protein